MAVVWTRLNSLRPFLLLSAVFFFSVLFASHGIWSHSKLITAVIRTHSVALFTVFLYFFSFFPSPCSLLHTYTSEYYPTKIRAMALSFLDIFVANLTYGYHFAVVIL